MNDPIEGINDGHGNPASSPGPLRHGSADHVNQPQPIGGASGEEPALSPGLPSGVDSEAMGSIGGRPAVPGERTGPLTPYQAGLVESVVPFVQDYLLSLRRRGWPITDEAESDAFWQVVQAARRHTQDIEQFRAYCRSWIHGAVCRALRRAGRYLDRSVDFSAVPEERAHASTVGELEVKVEDLSWVDFSSDSDDEYAQRLRLIKFALGRLEGPLARTAGAMKEGLGIRRIAKRFGISFHQARTEYDAVKAAIQKSLGLIDAEAQTEIRLPPKPGTTQSQLFADW